jgi:hypothetical protein
VYISSAFEKILRVYPNGRYAAKASKVDHDAYTKAVKQKSKKDGTVN